MITSTAPDASRVAINGHAARPLVVEFVGGIPGAGKTTVARACRALATSLGYPVYLQGAVKRCGRAIGRTRMALAFVRAPLFWRFLYHAFRSPPLSRTRNESFLAHRCRCLLEARWYFVMLYEFTRRNANSVVILDQWMSRKLDLAEDERATTVLRFLARSDAYFDRYYVFLDVPIDVSTDRAWRRARRRESGEERGWVREVFLSRRALREFYAEIHPSYLRRYSLFTRHGMKVLRLDGEQPAEDNARLIVERIIRPYLTAGEGRACAPPKERGAAMSPTSPRRPVLVEYLGAPGSGKTTLCAAVVSELRRDGFTITTRDAYFDWIRQPLPKKLRAVLAGGLRTWLFTAVLVYYFCSYCTLRGRSVLKVIYELTCMQAWLAGTLRHSPCSAVILDEFACHRLAFRLRDSRCIEAAGAQLTRLLFLFYPRCDVHWILKTVPVDVAAERISRRPMLNERMAKPIEALPAARAQAILDQHTRLAQFMFAAIQSRFGANAHLVDGARPLGDQVRCTKALLAGLLSGGMTAAHANRRPTAGR